MENIHQTLNIFWLEESISYECNQTGRRQDIKLGKKRDSYWGGIGLSTEFNPNTSSLILLQCKQVHIKPTVTKQNQGF